ncbi:hypothetical protein B9Z65_6665 [Elsinoe australis]|uniref:rRNA methyltransferase 1, mitochondrial n=1 Tax=Elsinoe australis TaxID=40998 RepID=A0A2P8ADW5_9PEZI|nr:hypothetical protein B9Z65_6665 [Elsinoe australis]
MPNAPDVSEMLAFKGQMDLIGEPTMLVQESIGQTSGRDSPIEKSAQKPPRYERGSVKKTVKQRRDQRIEDAADDLHSKGSSVSQRKGFLDRAESSHGLKPLHARKRSSSDMAFRRKDNCDDEDSRLFTLSGPEARNRPSRPQGIDDQSDGRKQRYHDMESGSYSIPLSTAASQFIYGRSAAFATLRAGRREIHKAYLNQKRLEESNSYSTITQLCSKLQTPIVHMHAPPQRQAMDRIAHDRPHNGIILDVSPLAFPPVTNLARPVDTESGLVTELVTGPQSLEEKRANQSLESLNTASEWRQPLVLLLDGVLDEGNMGNIIRSAHFYGVDAVAICTATCAPISSAFAAKAASGAMEAMPLLRLDRPTDFLVKSRKEGWEVWASVAPDEVGEPMRSEDRRKLRRGHEMAGPVERPVLTGEMRSPLREKPCILMMGAEGEGLRDIMKRRANRRVSIGGGEGVVDVGVDSLNVGSAAAVLLETFMRRPDGVRQGKASSERTYDSAQSSTNFKIRKFTRDDGMNGE